MSALLLIQKLKKHEIASSLSIMVLRVGMLAGKFLLSIFIARFIGLDALGIYGLVGGAAAIIQMVMRFGVFSTISRRAVGLPLEDLTCDLKHYGAGYLALYALLLPFVLVAGWYFNVQKIAVLAFLIVMLEHISYDIFVLTNNLHRPKLANVMLSVQSASWIYLFMALAFLMPGFRTLEWVFLFWIGGGVICTAFALCIVRHWPWKNAFQKPISFAWYKNHVMRSWKLYIGEIVSTVTLYMDRYIISFFLSLELVGVYMLFWQTMSAICNLIGAGVLQVYRPRLIAAYSENNPALFSRLFRESLRKSFIGTFVLSLGAGIALPFLVFYTNQPLAITYLPLLWFMLLASFFRIGTDACAANIYAQHKDSMIVKIVFLRLFIALVIGAIALYEIGIYGAVISILVTESIAVAYMKRSLSFGRHA